jgi:putative toxin-antitoxin system antitoxin component (TIGR02293 family)
MTHDSTSYAWIAAKAADLMGSHGAAHAWLANPAMGLDHQRPIDLLQTAQGAQLVEEFLLRLEYGVYN